MDDDSHLDRLATRDLTRRYALALGLVAVLTLAAQVVVQFALHRAQTDATVVNLAGRQRMLSQRLCKAALAWRNGPAADRDARLDEVRTVLGEWTASHRRLSVGADLPNAGIENSRGVAAVYAEIHGPFEAMATAAVALPDDPAAVDRLLREEPRFLAGQERIVGSYRDEAESRVRRLITLELWLCALLVVVLAAEALLVFRPAVRRLREAIHERELLRQRELEHRELQVAAEVSRRIGQDLHDGLGQTLTALSFQAKALERSLDERSAGRAAALGLGIAEAIAQARAHARRLAPVEIQAAGLESAVRELADSITRTTGRACTVTWDAGVVLPDGIGDDCYRIVQEAVTNALRHAQPGRIAIALTGRIEGSTLSIRNDGCLGAAGEPGLGLRSMRMRAGRHGGRVEAGTDGRDWLVRVLLPAADPGTGAGQEGRHAGGPI